MSWVWFCYGEKRILGSASSHEQRRDRHTRPPFRKREQVRDAGGRHGGGGPRSRLPGAGVAEHPASTSSPPAHLPAPLVPAAAFPGEDFLPGSMSGSRGSACRGLPAASRVSACRVPHGCLSPPPEVPHIAPPRPSCRVLPWIAAFPSFPAGTP